MVLDDIETHLFRLLILWIYYQQIAKHPHAYIDEKGKPLFKFFSTFAIGKHWVLADRFLILKLQYHTTDVLCNQFDAKKKCLGTLAYFVYSTESKFLWDFVVERLALGWTEEKLDKIREGIPAEVADDITRALNKSLVTYRMPSGLTFTRKGFHVEFLDNKN
jgi:hypothetical protein